MIFTRTGLGDSYVVELTPHGDDRGWFTRYYCKDEFKEIGFTKEWVQFNHSYTAKTGTVRGLHYQISPFQEIKLVRCIRGAIFDVIVDIRRQSPQFMKWIGVELNETNKKMLYIPEGFAHGFQCLTDNCELLYHHSCAYNKDAERGIRFSEPKLELQWPIPVTIVSDRDQNHPLLTNEFKGV